MSNTSYEPWSDDPNAPQLPYQLYTAEKEYFAGSVIAAVAYGILVALFFRCMGALLNPVRRTNEGIKWGLVAHTTAMLLFSTIPAAINRNVFSISYVDSREFSGFNGSPPGPLGYESILGSVQVFVSVVVFPFNQWLADGLLLYRCHVIYSMNYWTIAFPCLMYLATIATGILSLYEKLLGQGDLPRTSQIAYFSISLSLNVILTLMIIVRLALHNRNIRNAIGASPGPVGLYTAVITMLVESSAIYAIASLLLVIPSAAKSYVGYIFIALGEIQVIAPLLIILRVANRSALTSDAVTSGIVCSMHFRSGEGTTDDSEALPDEHTVGSIETNGGASGPLGLEVENASQDT